MTDTHLARLLVLCARPDGATDAGEAQDRLAAAVGDWDRAMAAAAAEGVLPLLYWRLRDRPGAVPGAVLSRLRAAFLGNLARNARIYRDLEPVLASARRAGLRASLTKGGRLAVDLYPDIGLRPFWDIDLVVHPADWPGLKRLLAGLGFAEASGPGPDGGGEADPAPGWTYSPYFRKGGLFLELHDHPLGLHFRGRGEDELWPAARPLRIGGTEVLVLPDEVELCFLCVHAQQHSYQRLVWLADIARLASRPGLDWGRVSGLARDQRVRGPVFHGLRLAAETWPRCVPAGALGALRPGPLEEAGQGLLWPPRATASRRPAPAWPCYMPTIFSLWERRDPLLAVRTLREIFFPPRAWLAAAAGADPRSAALGGRYLERLLRPAVTAARRLMGTG